jgi:ABC-type branched-subunit amino acid transport system permease subunit
MMVILGGMGRLHGAVIGAMVYVMLQELLSSSTLFGDYAKHWQLPMGSLIVLSRAVLFSRHRRIIDILLRRKEYGAAFAVENADD